jgi:hypothetical protein
MEAHEPVTETAIDYANFFSYPRDARESRVHQALGCASGRVQITGSPS